MKSLIREFADPEVRHHYVKSQIRTGLPLQLRAMRQIRGWNQTVLAKKTGTTQNAISRLENPKTCKPTIKTLLKMAKACNVALVVTFMPFSEYAKHLASASEISVAVPSFDDDPGLPSVETDRLTQAMSDPYAFYRPPSVIGPTGSDLAIPDSPGPVLVCGGTSTPNLLNVTAVSEVTERPAAA
jgi:transcriptional regulator with XRE-family HTH domain